MGTFFWSVRGVRSGGGEAQDGTHRADDDDGCKASLGYNEPFTRKAAAASERPETENERSGSKRKRESGA